MPEEREIPEFYSDQFEIMGGAYGITVNFRRSPSERRPEAAPETIARVRMSWEHVKAMTFIMWRYIKGVEQETGVSYPIPTKVLSDLRVAKEDWDSFWKPAPL